jgi:hypothetical protein
MYNRAKQEARMQKVEVCYRTLNAQPEDEMMPGIEIDILNEEITIAELIQRTVEAQIREILVERKLHETQAYKVLSKQYLTQEEIQEQATTGTINLLRSDQPPTLDSAREVRRAKRAFQERTYTIIVGGRPATRLDEKISMRPGNKITFLRLVPLVGG